MKHSIKFILLFTSLFTVWVSYNVFVSFRYQYLIREDQTNKSFSMNSDDVSQMPLIPNIGVTTIPIDALKSNYYFYEGHIRQADSLLSVSSKVNPYIHFSEYTKARYFMYTKNFDSAYVYAKKAFYGWPKYIEHYKLYNNTLVQRKDTLEILNAFDSIDKLFIGRNEYYQNFISSLSNAKMRYLITSYDSVISINHKALSGKWQQVYEFETGEVTKMNNTIDFSKNIFSNKESKYVFNLKDDTLFLNFTINNMRVAAYPIFFAPKQQTLILKNVPKVVTIDSLLYQDQFFKKIE